LGKHKKNKRDKRATLKSSGDQHLTFTNKKAMRSNEDLNLDESVRVVHGEELNGNDG
jgi:hypothetical protein